MLHLSGTVLVLYNGHLQATRGENGPFSGIVYKLRILIWVIFGDLYRQVALLYRLLKTGSTVVQALVCPDQQGLRFYKEVHSAKRHKFIFLRFCYIKSTVSGPVCITV